jgi:hypothetical protein
MSNAREAAEWGRASILMSLAFNASRDPKKTRPLFPKDFNPHWRKPRAAPAEKISFKELRTIMQRTGQVKRERTDVPQGH